MDQKDCYKIRIEDLNLYFATNHVLKGINLDIRKNSITALIGPSGCGKSTLLRCINRMNDVIDEVRIVGRIFLGHEDIYADDTDVTHLRKRVGMVFQRPVAFPLSIYENVASAPRVHGVSHKETLDNIVTSSLTKVGLWDEVADKLHKSALNLSLGQQQQLCVARVIASEPEVILLDEPCSALDPISTMKIEELMRQLAENYTVVIVTHSMQQAARASDCTVFMLSGEIIESGPTGEMFTSPRDSRTENYITGRFR
ncbi:MAG TPA: phosphate ABC transporter ATP-binding protein PstB [Bacillota bacterium]|jgi:phosphate transport system ATP-binding protein|nr:phosphate ABC transporter ATP-binding protein PstB [Bacillota bacterium]